MATTPGVYDFENVNAIKKKAVRGLLLKRAKKYDSESSGRDSDPEEENAGLGAKRHQKVNRKTMLSAFKMIMAKKISEPADDQPA